MRSRSLLSGCLRRGSVRLLGLGLESHRGLGSLSILNVFVVRCRFQILITGPQDPTECAVSVCYLETLRIGKP